MRSRGRARRARARAKRVRRHGDRVVREWMRWPLAAQTLECVDR
jgi:hypothetical protein